MAKRTIFLVTTLSVDECLRRIEGVADRARATIFSLSGYRGLLPLLIKINGDQVEIWKRIYYRKYVQRVFYARIIPGANGTRLEGHFDMPRLQRIGNLIYVAVMTAVAVPYTVAFFTDPPDLLDDGWSKLLPLGMLIVGLLSFTFGRFFGGEQERFITETLRETLDARVQIPEPDPVPTDAYTNRPIG